MLVKSECKLFVISFIFININIIEYGNYINIKEVTFFISLYENLN